MLYSFSRLFPPARPRPLCAAAVRKKRGFNLIEAAIVLGVVGLVIGGIWVGAATMYENYKVTKTIEGITAAADKIRQIITIRDSSVIGDGIGITTLVRESRVFPEDWIKGSTIRTPLGGYIHASNYYGATYNNFNIQIFELDKAVCIKLIVQISNQRSVAEAQYSMRGQWRRIQANVTFPPASNFNSFPISIGDAQTACHKDTDNSVYIYYGYTNTN